MDSTLSQLLVGIVSAVCAWVVAKLHSAANDK